MEDLIKTLYQVVGNKRYMHDIEKYLKRIEITPKEKHTLRYLIADLKELKQKAEHNPELKRYYGI